MSDVVIAYIIGSIVGMIIGFCLTYTYFKTQEELRKEKMNPTTGVSSLRRSE
jgi:uncharacterized membrane-anchored protein YhcB (DUF1043 family)